MFVALTTVWLVSLEGPGVEVHRALQAHLRPVVRFQRMSGFPPNTGPSLRESGPQELPVRSPLNSGQEVGSLRSQRKRNRPARKCPQRPTTDIAHAVFQSS